MKHIIRRIFIITYVNNDNHNVLPRLEVWVNVDDFISCICSLHVFMALAQGLFERFLFFGMYFFSGWLIYMRGLSPKWYIEM